MDAVFEAPDGTRWRREGECCRCGECCRGGDPFNGTEGAPEIPGACPLLRLLPNGLHACSDRRHPGYLNGCNVWPTMPEHVAAYPSCTYVFVREV